MPDVFQNGGPRRDADAGADEDGNLVFKDVFRGRTVRAVDAQARHLGAGLQRDFVHAVWIDLVIEFGGCRAGADGIGQCASKVSGLAHMHADVGVKGAGRDGEWMPLMGGHFRTV